MTKSETSKQTKASSPEHQPTEQHPIQHQDRDVVIIGAGPAGLSMALSLRGMGLNVTVLEKQKLKDIQHPKFDGREIALSHRSVDLLREMGAWDRIPGAEISELREAKVMNGGSPSCLHFSPRASREDQLGHLVSNNLIRQSLFEEFEASDAAELLTDSEVEDIKTGADGAEVRLKNGATFSARLLIAADTRFSAARRTAGIPAAMHDFGRTMIVSRAKFERPHDHVATEFFLYGGAFAILPLNNNEASIVQTFEPEEATRWMAMDDEEYVREASHRIDHQFGKMTPVGDRFAYPLVGVYANKFVSKSFALVGDAAVGMHPVTAHGFNLGVQGQAILATQIKKAVAKGLSPADPSALAAYQRAHRKLSAPIFWGTVGLAELYSMESLPGKIARKALLNAGRFLPPARDMIVRRLSQRLAMPVDKMS